MQNWIATCTLPHKDCVVQSSIEATVPSPCFGKRCARSSLVKGKIDWTMTSLKIYWELSISPSSLFSESSLSDVLLSKERRWWVTKRMQKNVDCRRCVKAWLSWNMAGHISAPVSLEWFPPSFKNRLKRIDLGKMMIDFVFFSNALAEPEVLASTECRWWMKTNVQGRPSWVMAGQQSAPVGLEWFPPSFKNRLKCIGLGNMMIDPAFFPNALVGPKVLVSKERRWWMKTHVQRDVEVGEVPKEG